MRLATRSLDRVFRGRGSAQVKTLVQKIKDLFKDGQQGAWYDPTDLTTLFQDSAGTNPCTMPGQGVAMPVGLMLDKRLGLTLGSELVTNGDFSSSTGWTVPANWSISGGKATQSAGISTDFLQRSISMSAGKWYKVSVDIDAINTGTGGVFSVRFIVGGVSTLAAAYTTSGAKSFIYSPTSGVSIIRLAINVHDASVIIDNISVRELPGNHASQSTSTSRPTLSAKYNLLTYTEFPNGVTDAPTRGGLVTATTLTGYSGALAFGHDGATGAYAYKAGAPTSTAVKFSVVVRMDDGNAPSFGSATASAGTNSFVFVIRGDAISPTSYSTTSLGGGFYRVSVSVTTAAFFDNNGVLKYPTNDSRTFKVTAYDLRAANESASLPPYQRVVDALTYDTAGFPLFLLADGSDDWMQTNSIDFSASDKMFVAAGVRNFGTTGAVMAELGTAYTGGGGFGFFANDGGSGVYGAAVSGVSGQVSASQGTYAAPISNVVACLMDISLSSSALKLRVDGALIKQSGSTALGGGNFASNRALYFYRRGGTTLPFNGRFYGCIIRSGTLPTTTEIGNAEKFLSGKMGGGFV